MPTDITSRAYRLQEGEKVTKVMAYTLNLIAWGEVITKEAIRVSVWLRTPAAPQYLSLRNAQVLHLSSTGQSKPQHFQELHVPVSQIIAFHIMPPESDPLDYDPDEPHRLMAPATALVGSFRFDGLIRMSDLTNLERYLDVTKEVFTSLYDVEISQPGAPSMGVLRVPFAILRRDMILFAAR